MPTHAERKVLPYSREQLYDMVADIEKYPEFLPWCVGARIRRREEDNIIADLVIGFKMIRERFTSEVKLSPPDRIDVQYREGPFRYLDNHWTFNEVEGGTEIDFYVDFEFKSRMLQKIMGALFNEAVQLMVRSFEKRAKELYG